MLAAGARVHARPPQGAQALEVRSETIDALVGDGTLARVDFLKVDVGDGDLAVLRGAAETIRTQRPRLAVAYDHRPDDLARIPGFVASLGVGYRWHLQCSTLTRAGTVAFGVRDDA